jgi:uncharacterized protein
MPQTPRILRNYNLFVTGMGLAGLVETVRLPELALVTEDFDAAGYDAAVEMEVGMEKMDCELVLHEATRAVLGNFGLAGAMINITLRAAMQDKLGVVSPFVAKLRGNFTRHALEALAAKGRPKLTSTFHAEFYELTHDGIELYYIDIPNFIRRVNGIDQLAAMRAVMGLV